MPSSTLLLTVFRPQHTAVNSQVLVSIEATRKGARTIIAASLVPGACLRNLRFAGDADGSLALVGAHLRRDNQWYVNLAAGKTVQLHVQLPSDVWALI